MAAEDILPGFVSDSSMSDVLLALEPVAVAVAVVVVGAEMALRNGAGEAVLPARSRERSKPLEARGCVMIASS